MQRLQASLLGPLLHALTVDSVERSVERQGPRLGVECRRVTHKARVAGGHHTNPIL